jgi:Cys-rich protein (TIGR01571 family)
MDGGRAEASASWHAWPPPPSHAAYRDWHFSLCRCADDPALCIDVVMCPHCQMARQFDALNGYWDSCEPFVCFATLFGPLLWVVNVYIRCRVVRKYSLLESPVATVVFASVCWPCSACQTYRELNERGVWPGGTACVPRPARMDAYPRREHGADRELFARASYGTL